VFRLYIYIFMAKETMKKLLQNISFITKVFPPPQKFYLNQTSITIKKNLIQEEASKAFSSILKFHINVFYLERITLNAVLLVKRKVFVTIRHVILSNNINLL